VSDSNGSPKKLLKRTLGMALKIIFYIILAYPDIGVYNLAPGYKPGVRKKVLLKIVYEIWAFSFMITYLH
jgi:hypothetical protein